MTDLAYDQRSGPRMLTWAMVYSTAIVVVTLSVVLW